MMVRTTPEHKECLEEIKALVVRWSGQLPAEEIQGLLAQVVGFLLPLTSNSIEGLEDLVGTNMAMGVMAGYEALKGEKL